MSIINGTKIVAPVGVEDVRRVLGEASTDIGTLCTSDKINRWAKFKPYAINQIAPISDAQRAQFGYGIVNIPYYTSPYDMAVFIHNESLMQDGGVPVLSEYFTYSKPYETGPKRLSDFAGYDHTAKPPVAAPPENEFLLRQDTDLTIDFDIELSTSHVELFDLSLFPSGVPTDLKNYYFGAVITDGTSYAMAIQPTQVSMIYVNGASVTFSYHNISSMTNKSVAVCGILSPITDLYQPAPSDDTPYVPLLFAMKNITLRRNPEDSDFNFELTAWRVSPTAKDVNVRYSVQNRSAVSWPISNPRLVFFDSYGISLKEHLDEDFELPAKQIITHDVLIPFDNTYAAKVTFMFDVYDREFGVTKNITQGAPQ